METTFISIHDLTPSAHILYSSESIIDILGYTPDEVVHRSAWDFFPLEELPYAQSFHKQRVAMDKAAVLAYCRVRDKQGQWVGCECCFTIVYDVMIVCTSVYRRGVGSEKRALEAPVVRRMFSSSPNDPRYHMLSHISGKFKLPSKTQTHEPRAALFLNRFTRTLTIMYATSGLQEIIGIPAEAMHGRSFYYCIAENCLQDAVKCLENAKGNDSIAYLRFWFRDPRLDDAAPPPDDDSDEEMGGTEFSTASEDGGVQLHHTASTSPDSHGSTHSNAVRSTSSTDIEDGMDIENGGTNSRTSSGDSTHAVDTHEAIFGSSRAAEESTSSLEMSPDRSRARSPRVNGHRPAADPIELEAVISCTSDGLVVCLRKARPMIPHPTHRPSRPMYENGMFAAPWAQEPILPSYSTRANAGFAGTFAPALGPYGARHPSPSASVSPVRANGAQSNDFMAAIRDQAIFAWALTGINGSLERFAQGKALGESVPADGLPVWATDVGGRASSVEGGRSNRSDGTAEARSSSGSANGWHERPGTGFFGDPGLSRNGNGYWRHVPPVGGGGNGQAEDGI